MAVKYLWDTNTAIYFLQKQLPPAARKFVEDLFNKNQPAISFISEIELLCWKSADNNALAVINSFIADCEVIGMDDTIKLKTVDIRKTCKTKLPDAIIAATALSINATLITRNKSDFRNITGLEIIDPWEI